MVLLSDRAGIPAVPDLSTVHSAASRSAPTAADPGPCRPDAEGSCPEGWPAASSRNRSAAGASGPARWTTATPRTMGGSGWITWAPRAWATVALGPGTRAAPAPASTRGRMASRWAVTTATWGTAPAAAKP